MNIPIFNQHQTKSNVQTRKVEFEKAQLERERLIWDLRGIITKLETDVKNAQAELVAASGMLVLAQQDFNQSEFKFKAGVINYTELLNKKDRLFQAQSNLVQSKYNYYFSITTITTKK